MAQLIRILTRQPNISSRLCSFVLNRSCHSPEPPVSWSVYNVKKAIKCSKWNFEDGHTSIQTVCPACDSSTVPNNERIFINKITGNFVCPKCHHLGKWTDIEGLFESPKTKAAEEDQSRRRDIFRNQKKPKGQAKIEHLEDASSVSTDVLDDFLLQAKLSFQVGQLKELDLLMYENEMYLPLRSITDEIVGYKILKITGDERSVPDRSAFGLVIRRPERKRETSAAIIVDTVRDFLALAIQRNLNYTIICLPHGKHSLPQECLPGLEKYQKLVLWLNYNDAAGWDVARGFAKKLDEKRCYFIRPTDTQPSPYKAFEQHLEIKAILSKGLPALHQSITTFQRLRQDVLSDLQNLDKVQGVKWKRFPTLSKLLKGHRKGELTVLTGSTGCGKTTFMSEYSLDLALQNVTTLWGSFEIRNTRLAATLLRQLAGHPFDPHSNMADFTFWADEFEKLPLYFMTFHGQQSIKVVMEAIEHATYVNDIQHVIIDNVQFMMGMSDEVKHGDRFWKQDSIIAAFRTFATKKNVHVTLVIHPRKEKDSEDLSTSSIFGSAKASQEADNVLIIQDRRLQSIRGKKFLQVAKNRYSGDLGIMPLEFDKNALSYAQKSKPKVKHEPE